MRLNLVAHSPWQRTVTAILCNQQNLVQSSVQNMSNDSKLFKSDVHPDTFDDHSCGLDSEADSFGTLNPKFFDSKSCHHFGFKRQKPKRAAQKSPKSTLAPDINLTMTSFSNHVNSLNTEDKYASDDTSTDDPASLSVDDAEANTFGTLMDAEDFQRQYWDVVDDG